MIQKPLSCKIKKSDVQFDYENVIIKYTDGYESEIKKMISIIYDEIGDIWDEMWTWDDVVDRFEKGHFLWLVFDEGSPVACSWFEKKSKQDLYIYNHTSKEDHPLITYEWFPKKVKKLVKN